MNSLCHSTDTDPPLIYLGTMDNRWYSEAVITQNIPDDFYKYTDMTVYAVPSKNVDKYSKYFHCEAGGWVEVLIGGLYLPEDTVMKFNICINSTDSSEDGWTDINFYDNITSWNHRGEPGSEPIKQHTFHIDAGETNCFPYTFVAPKDSYYYIMSGVDRTNCKEISYTLDVDIESVNASDWLSASHQSTCKLSEGDPKCSLKIKNDGSTWFFSPEKYDIFGLVTSATTHDNIGHLSIQPTFRESSYAVPTLAGVLPLALVEIVVIIFVVCYCRVYHKKRERRAVLVKECEEVNIQ